MVIKTKRYGAFNVGFRIHIELYYRLQKKKQEFFMIYPNVIESGGMQIAISPTNEQFCGFDSPSLKRACLKACAYLIIGIASAVIGTCIATCGIYGGLVLFPPMLVAMSLGLGLALSIPFFYTESKIQEESNKAIFLCSNPEEWGKRVDREIELAQRKVSVLQTAKEEFLQSKGQ